MDSASARRRKVGAEVITPSEASAMPPDLMKYLLFMIVFLEKNSRSFCALIFVLCSSFSLSLRCSSFLDSNVKVPGTKHQVPVLLSLKLRRSKNQSRYLDDR